MQLVFKLVDCLVLFFYLVSKVLNDAGVALAKIFLTKVHIELAILKLRLQIEVFSFEAF